MISSLNKAVITAFLLSAAAMPAYAADAPHDTLTLPPQTTAPMPAAAEPAPPTATTAVELVPAGSASTTPDPAASEPISSAAPPPATITAEPVSEPSIEGLGVLDEKTGGLPATVWKDTTHETAAALLSWIHAGVANAGIRDVTVQLLMSQANAPTGSGPDWFSDRVRALVAIGQDEKAEQMIAVVPASMMTDSLQQLRVELLLLRGDTPSACKMSDATQASPPVNSTNPLFWQKLNIVCKMMNGKKDEATLALDLMRETNAKDEAFLQDIVHRMSDKTFSIKAMPTHWSVFDVAVVKIAGETDKLKDKVDSLPPITLKYIAGDATLDPKLRDKAAGRAGLLGIMPLEVNKPLPQPFVRNLAGDVTTLVNSLGSDAAPTDAEDAVIARLAVDENASLQDCRRVMRLLAIMEPFGYHVAPPVWDKLLQRKNRFDGDVTSAALTDRITEAGKAGRKGEVILLAALTLAGSDVEKASDLVLVPVIKGLINAGFTKEARKLAYDAVQSYGTH